MTNSLSSKTNNTEIKLLQWCNAQLLALQKPASRQSTALSGDASFRKYFRLSAADCSYIAVYAPPQTEKNTEFVAVSKLLNDAGLLVPQVLAADYEQGYLLQTDLGDRLLLPELNNDSVEHLYGEALKILGQIQSISSIDNLHHYERAQMREDLQRFPEWFAEGLLKHEMSRADADVFDAFCEQLLETALEQPQCLTHYDFQSRNLMLNADNEIAVIDFQDALIAPMTYDLASLLRDCYIKWPVEDTRRRALKFAASAKQCGTLNVNVSDSTFLRWFDYMSLQRHVRVLGTFARLFIRDDKPGYLGDIPMVCEYVSEVAASHAEFGEFSAWFDSTLLPIAQQQDWFRAS